MTIRVMRAWKSRAVANESSSGKGDDGRGQGAEGEVDLLPSSTWSLRTSCPWKFVRQRGQLCLVKERRHLKDIQSADKHEFRMV